MTYLKTTSPKQTQKLAGSLAKEILKARIKNKNALIFALSGDLGSGKTSFTQGFLRGMGIKKKITSPTFVLLKNYELRIKNNYGNYKRAYHMDCYRIKKSGDLAALGLKEILKNPENIVLIEWAERIKKILPKNTIWIKFKHGEKENERKISI
jgi:tRNA threonylcarbamoyladenosine biosynthesis protein TsaE